jgi:hypothetical protein
VVDISEIAENDFNLNIRRYADTSPPPEIFDVRALLHGGVPVREVHDDYIQKEILKGFDISAVFPAHPTILLLPFVIPAKAGTQLLSITILKRR